VKLPWLAIIAPQTPQLACLYCACIGKPIIPFWAAKPLANTRPSWQRARTLF